MKDDHARQVDMNPFFVAALAALALGVAFSEAGLGLLTAMSILFAYAFSRP